MNTFNTTFNTSYNGFNGFNNFNSQRVPQQTYLPGFTPFQKTKRAYVPYAPSSNESLMAAYNDPYEINSLADAILTTFDKGMRRTEMFGLEDIPILNIIPATLLDLSYKRVYKPLLRGEGMTAGINSLINVGETLDVIAGPTKALLFGEGKQGFKDALGIGGRGRRNFDYDTGNLFKDIGLELISDPLNWVTLFGKGIIVQGGKAVTKQLMKEAAEKAGVNLAKELGEETAEHVYKKLSKAAVQAYIEGDTAKMVQHMTKIAETMTNKGWFNFTRIPIPEDFLGVMDKIVTATTDNMSKTVLHGLQQIIKPVEKFEGMLAKTAFASTGVTPAWWVMKKSADWVTQFIEQRTTKALDPYVMPDGNISIMTYPQSYEAYVNNINDLKAFNTMDATHLMTPEMHTISVRNSIKADEAYINELFQQLNNDPVMFEKELTEYVQKMRGANSIDEYMEQLDIINRATGGKFVTEQKMLQDQLERIYKAKSYQTWKATNETISASEDLLNTMTDQLSRLLHDPTKLIKKEGSIIDDIDAYKINEYDDFEDRVVSAIDKKSHGSGDISIFKNHMDVAFKFLERQKGYDPSSVYEALMKAYTVYNQNYIEPFYAYWDNLFMNMPLGTEFADFAQHTWLEVEQILNKWRNDMENQIYRVQKHIKQTGDLYNIVKNADGTKTKKSWIDYDKVHPAKQLQRILDDRTNLIKKIRKRFKEFQNDDADVYNKFDTFFNNTGKQARLMEKIIQTSASLLIKERKDIPINFDELKKLRTKLFEKFGLDIAGWLDQNKQSLKNLNIAPAAFAEKFTNFIAFKDWDIEKYAAVYYDLQGYLKQIISSVSREKSDAIDLFKEIETELAAFNPYEMVNKTLKLESGGLYIQPKLEQLFTTFYLLNNPQLNQLVSEIKSNTGLGKAINNFMDMGDSDNEVVKQIISTAQELINSAEFYHNYMHFINKLYQAPVSDYTRLTFLSTLQNYAWKDPSAFIENYDKLLPEIFKRMESYQYSTKMLEEYNLDALSEKHGLDELIAEKYNLEPEPHTAWWDVLRTEEMMANLLPTEFDDGIYQYVLLDIETSGLVKGRDQIYEISFKNYGDKELPTMLRRGVDAADKLAIPPPDALETFFPGLPYEAQLAAFLEKYSPAKHQLTEEQVLREFAEYLDTLPGNAVLVAHNGKEFDFEAIQKRMQFYNIKTRTLKNSATLDTLQLLKEKNGYRLLTEPDKEWIGELLHEYSEIMAQSNSGSLINPSNGSLAHSLISLSRQLEEAATKNINGFKTLSQPELASQANMFRKIGADLYDMLQFISRSNKSYNDYSLNVDMLKNSDEVYKAFLEFAQESLGLSAEQVSDKFGRYLNPSKLFFGLSDGANFMGYKKTINVDLIKAYFNFDYGTEIDADLAKRLTTIATRLDRSRTYIRNPEKLIFKDGDFDMAAEIQRMLQTLTPEKFLPNFTTLPGAPQWFSRLYENLRTTNDDVMSNWVALQHLYTKYKRAKIPADRIYAQFDQRLIDLLENPQELRAISKNEMDLNRADRSTKMWNKAGNLVDLTIDNKIVNVRAYKEVQENFNKNTVAPFENLAREMDAKDIYRTKTQALGSATKTVDDMLQMYIKKIQDSAPNVRVALHKNSIAVKAELDAQATLNGLKIVASGNIANIQTHLLRNCHRVMMLDTADLIDKPAFLEQIQAILSNKKLLDEAHIGVNTEGTKLTIFLKKSADAKAYVENKGWLSTEEPEVIYTILGEKIGKAEIDELDYDTAFKAMNDPELEDALRKSRDSIRELSEHNMIGSTGETTSKSFYKNMYESLPKAVLKELPEIDDLLDDVYFKAASFNFSRLGTTATRLQAEDYVKQSIVDQFRISAENSALYAKSRIQYTQLYFDKSWSINNGWLKDASDEHIMQSFKQSPEFVLAALVQDTKRKHGYKVIEIKPTNADRVALARRLDAVVLPSHTFSKMFETINGNIMGQSFLNLMHKITYLYKVGFLLDPGVWMRNLIDSTMKTMIETQSFSGTFKAAAEAEAMLLQHDKIWKEIVERDQVAQYLMQMDPRLKAESARYQAMKMFQEHSSELDNIMKMDIHGRITEENVEFYFQKMSPKMDKAMFDFVHSFIFDGPSAGLTKELEEYFIGAPEGAWATFVHANNWLMGPNKHIEQINRLAEYILLAEKGLTNTEIFYKIAKTHFDYAIKTDWEKMIEIVFPFYTFTMKNVEYWIDAVNNHTWMAYLFRDIMMPIWNFDDTDYDELKRNRSLQYQILSGNIPIGEYGMTLKTSPSFTDVFNLMTNPLDNVQGKLFTPIQTITGAGMGSGIFGSESGAGGAMLPTILKSLPMIGAEYQRYFETGPRNHARTGNVLNALLPGVFGATMRFSDKVRPPKQKGGGRFRKPRKAWKSFAKKTYARKTYAKKTYAKKSYAKNIYAKRAYAPNYYHRINTPTSIYKDIYTKTGTSRFKQRLLPIKAGTIKYKLRLMWSTIR